MEYKNKKVLVCGMARSGISAAKLLKQLGAEVTLQDLKNRDDIEEDVSSLEDKGIVIYDGKNPDDIVEEQDLIVISPGIPCDLPFVMKAKEKNIPVISEIELSYTLCPCPIAAITGTNGKTTTTTLAGEMIKTKYENFAIVGNIGVPFSEEVPELNDKSFVVAEISSFQLESCDTFHPRVSAVLNITPDHLNRHKTLENYIAMKERVFENQTEEDYCILNYDDEVCRAMAGKTKAQVLFFSSHNTLDKGIYLKGDDIVISLWDMDDIVINVNDMQILGSHNYENAMAAILIALCAGVTLDGIRQVLREFMGVEHRIEYVTTVDGVDYYNDSKGTNPDAAIRAVLAMKKPIVLIGGGYDKQSEYDEWVKTFEGRVKHLVLIGETADKIEETCHKYGFDAVTRAAGLKNAVEKCQELAESGDCVLLSPACASWDMFEDYEQRGKMFKFMVRALIRNEKGKRVVMGMEGFGGMFF